MPDALDREKKAIVDLHGQPGTGLLNDDQEENAQLPDREKLPLT